MTTTHINRGRQTALTTLKAISNAARVAMLDRLADASCITDTTMAVVNASGGLREHYEQFVALALEHRKLLLIETGTARAQQWFELCRAARVPTVVLWPRDGVHPVTPKRKAFH